MLPFETRLALFPRRALVVRLGMFRSIRLHPVTLGRAAVMEMFDCGLLNGRLNASQALLAAWILSVDEDRVADIANGDMAGGSSFVKSLGGSVAKVTHAVNVLVGEAMLPFIPPKKEDGAVEIDDGLPKGNGWPLEITEALCAHYGWGFDEVLRIEVQKALALIAVSRQRNSGGSGGPDYYDRIRIERWKKAGIITHSGGTSNG